MAESFAYDHPTYQVRMGNQITAPAANAQAVANRFVAFANMKIKGIRGAVNVAGTSTAAGYEFLNGTSTVGSITFGTSAAGATGSATITAANAAITAGNVLDVKTLAASATIAANFVIEYDIDNGANVS